MSASSWLFLLAAFAALYWLASQFDNQDDENGQAPSRPEEDEDLEAIADPVGEDRYSADQERWRRESAVRLLQDEFLLDRISPLEFEEIMLVVFEAEGWSTQRTPRTSDHGVDGYLKKDGYLAVMQCKHKKRPVSPKDLREFFGVLHRESADLGYFVSSSGFTPQAREWTIGLEPMIVLIDGEGTMDLIRKHMTVVRQRVSDLRIPDIEYPQEPSCPRCDRSMNLVRVGSRAFWGCPAFPSCRGSQKLSRLERYYASRGIYRTRRVRSKSRRW